MPTNDKTHGGAAVDLRGLRTAAGLSQQRVAELAGCSLAAVALFERGYRPSSSSVLPRIIATLHAEGRPAGNGDALHNLARDGATWFRVVLVPATSPLTSGTRLPGPR